MAYVLKVVQYSSAEPVAAEYRDQGVISWEEFLNCGIVRICFVLTIVPVCYSYTNTMRDVSIYSFPSIIWPSIIQISIIQTVEVTILSKMCVLLE